jgi:hypothetical protein
VLGGVVASAVAAALMAACSSSSSSGSCGNGGIVASDPVSNGGVDAGTLWITQYGVDPSCCGPQLAQVFSFQKNATIAQGCQFAVDVPCGAAGVNATQACAGWCSTALGGSSWNCFPQSSYDGGGVQVSCMSTGSGCGTGRPPRGFAPLVVPAATRLGERLAIMAQLEAASVAAFDALHADLARLGAPRSLLRSVLAARRDEVRHARLACREAARHGAITPAAVVAPIAPRSLEALAIANAEEGCVVETFGAALLALQAERATDPRLRAMLKKIAADELRHAALSWRIHAWLAAKLPGTSRARLADARTHAVAALRTGIVVSEAHDPLGSPSPSTLDSLVDALSATLETGALPTAA